VVSWGCGSAGIISGGGGGGSAITSLPLDAGSAVWAAGAAAGAKTTRGALFLFGQPPISNAKLNSGVRFFRAMPELIVPSAIRSQMEFTFLFPNYLGSIIRKVVPRFNSEENSMLPLWSWIILDVMARPTPVPPGLVVK